MDKPVYEIPVSGDVKSWGFPPPVYTGPASNESPPASVSFTAPVYELPVEESIAFATPAYAPMPHDGPTSGMPASFAPPALAQAMHTPPPMHAPPPVYDMTDHGVPAPMYRAAVDEPRYQPPRPQLVDESIPPPTLAAPSVDDANTRTRRRAATAVEVGPDPDLILALEEVLRTNASDLHVTTNAPPMLRLDGALMPGSFTEAWNVDKVTSALRSILTPAQEETFDTHLELDFAYTISENARFRVNFYQQRGAIGGAFRIIPTEIKQLDELGVPDTVAQFARLARGLVLVTGPTGSGKSTTLAALVDLVNRTRADHIMTVEDPIEFLHSNHKSLVNQREVGNDTHSFAAALKHVLRQDPDVILVGELRDLETVSVALTAAETGHLVFATLHTQDAAQTIDRIIDVFPPHQQGQVRAQLAATLQGVVCQTLIKKASGKGRVVATEVLVATPAINNLIREGKTYQISSSMQAGREHGMFTMDQHLAELANRGQITVRAAYETCPDEETLKRLISRQETQEGGMPVGIDLGGRKRFRAEKGDLARRPVREAGRAQGSCGHEPSDGHDDLRRLVPASRADHPHRPE